MNDTFFKKTSEKICDFRISTLCLDQFSKQGCRHWILYENGKTNQLRREEIIDLLSSKKVPLPWHYRSDKNEKNKNDEESEKKYEKKEHVDKREKKCIIS